jgi:uncharacterized protein with FMN-binding domain
MGSLLLGSSILISWRIGLPDYVEAAQPIAVVPSTPPTATQTQSPDAPQETDQAEVQANEPQVQVLDSDEISYKYGIVQVQVTMTDSQITDVKMLQGEATNGRAQAYAMLIDATLQVQGTTYGNVTGATYTTEAFKDAVNNALNKAQLP